MDQKRIFLTIGTLSPVSMLMHRDEIVIPDEPGNERKAAEILTEAVAEVYSVDPDVLYWAVFSEKNANVPILCSENIKDG